MGKTTTLVKSLVNVCGEVTNDDLVWTWHWGSGNTSLDLKTSGLKCCVSVGMGTRQTGTPWWTSDALKERQSSYQRLSSCWPFIFHNVFKRNERTDIRDWMLLINTLFLVYVLKQNQISTLHESIIAHLWQAFIFYHFILYFCTEVWNSLYISMSHDHGNCNSSYFDTHQVIKLILIIPNDNNYEIIMI